MSTTVVQVGKLPPPLAEALTAKYDALSLPISTGAAIVDDTVLFATVALSGVAPCACAAETVTTEGPQGHKNQKGQVCRTIASSSSEADSAA
jgi:hypothetical protein